VFIYDCRKERFAWTMIVIGIGFTAFRIAICRDTSHAASLF
jgi:hypothetical protein